MLNFDLQNHKPLREIVYEELKRQILKGEIAPGHRMMEVELADDMGVSRTPVREAIRKLEKEGLVTIEPRKGAYASDISIKEMVDVLEVRQYLESLAAGMAAARITPEEKLQLQEATDAYKQAIESEDTSEIIKWDENFHKIIVDCSGNKTLIQMISQVQELALRFRYIYYDDEKQSFEVKDKLESTAGTPGNRRSHHERQCRKSQKGSKRAFSQTQGVCHAAGRKNRQRRPIGLLFVLQGISGRVLE